MIESSYLHVCYVSPSTAFQQGALNTFHLTLFYDKEAYITNVFIYNDNNQKQELMQRTAKSIISRDDRRPREEGREPLMKLL